MRVMRMAYINKPPKNDKGRGQQNRIVTSGKNETGFCDIPQHGKPMMEPENAGSHIIAMKQQLMLSDGKVALFT